MRAFACPHCRNLVHFENTSCLTCARLLAYERAHDEIRVLEPDVLACANRDVIGCNWTSDPERPDGLCSCCALTRTRPSDSDAAGLAAWAEAETAKRMLVRQLDKIGLPVTSRSEDRERGLAFDLLSSAFEDVITGHADGIVTIDLAEGADPHREALRIQLAEPYRTMLGHLRHETGHWYWQVLVEGSAHLDRFRALFGDEREDYGAALEAHYGRADDHSWAATHVSHYAAAHPWEDWAETFAHYLHARDTYDTAASWRVGMAGPDLDPPVLGASALVVRPDADPADFDALIANWIPLTLALNAFNRGMGKDDLYPFVLTPAVLDKLRFVHDVVLAARTPPWDT